MNDIEIISDCLHLSRAISDMTVEAFAREYGTGDAEAALIASLRKDGDVVVELAALEREQLVGHILFSRASDEPQTGTIAALAPMCVRTGKQKSGIGSALVREGLKQCASRGIAAVIVLGDPNYYSRFGFSVACARGISCAYAGPHFQALELVPGALRSARAVAYAPAFAASGV